MFGKADEATFDGVMASLEKTFVGMADVGGGAEEGAGEVVAEEVITVVDAVGGAVVETAAAGAAVGESDATVEVAAQAPKECPLPERCHTTLPSPGL